MLLSDDRPDCGVTAPGVNSPLICDGLTPLQKVQHKYRAPDFIQEHPIQVEVINELAVLDRQGIYLDMGTGKTYVFTMIALYAKITRGARVVLIMPPILLTQWARWLELFSVAPGAEDTTRPLKVTVYRGTPTQRKKLSLDADFVLVGVQIFKKDYNRFVDFFYDKQLVVGVDEATIIAGINSDAHEKVYDFAVGQPVALLTGTPLDKPTDAYGLMKFTAPGKYRHFKHFCNVHVEEYDFYDRPSKYQNLELLSENLMTNARRVLYSDMYSDIQTPLYVPLEYELTPKHYQLYEQLSNDELLKLPDGGKIDATTENKLVHALGQIIVNWGHFAGDPSLTSAAIELIEQKLAEMGSKKLIVFANYKMTVAKLVSHFGPICAGGINSEATPKQKDQAKDLFISDPSKRLIVIQYKSGGMGLDGFQHVCHHAMGIEPCTSPRDFHQAVARINRTGQRYRCMMMMAIARGTVQKRKFKDLLRNDTLVNQVVRNVADLRKLIFGK